MVFTTSSPCRRLKWARSPARLTNTHMHSRSYTHTNKYVSSSSHTYQSIQCLEFSHTQSPQSHTPAQRQHVGNLCSFFQLLSPPLLSLSFSLPLDFLSNLLSQAGAKRYKVKSVSIRWSIVLTLAVNTQALTNHMMLCVASDQSLSVFCKLPCGYKI